MSDEKSLLAPITASPEDDVPRLVYADWLEEHGQPERAEFIRVQIALASPVTDHATFGRLMKREAELRATHAELLAGSLAGPGLRWHFRRGFIHGFGHDGVYVSALRDETHYLRFCPDGDVVTLSSTGPVEDAPMRIAEGALATGSRGRYSLLPMPPVVQVGFSSTGEAGTVDYTGIIEGQSVLLSTHSRINGRRARLRYARVDL